MPQRKLLSRAWLNPLHVLTVAGIISVTATANAVAAGDNHAVAEPARPVAELVPVCAACHGETGTGTNETFPNLGGQYRDYLYYSLKSYKSGVRDNAIMKAQVVGLTNEEMESLAKWYSSQEASVYTPSRSTWRGD